MEVAGFPGYCFKASRSLFRRGFPMASVPQSRFRHACFAPALLPATLIVTLTIVASIAPSSSAFSLRASTWVDNGAPVAPSLGRQVQVVMVPDGAGGAIYSWIEGGNRAGQFAQHRTPAGEVWPGWPESGRFICSMDEDAVMAADRQGGAYLAASMHDPFNPGLGLVLNHMTGQGTDATGWPTGGIDFYGEPLVEAARLGDAPAAVQGVSGDTAPALTTSPDGGVLLAMTHTHRAPHEDLVAMSLATSGAPDTGWSGGIAVNVPNTSQWAIGIVPDSGRGMFVLYAELPEPNGGAFGVHVQVGDNITITRPFRGIGGDPGIASDGSGGALVFWHDTRTNQIYGQHYLSNDSTAAGWPADGLLVCSHPSAPGGTLNYYGTPVGITSVATDGAGGAFVAWVDYRDSTGTGTGDIYAQHVRGDGTLAPGWPADGLPICTAPGDQRHIAIAPDGHGGLLLAWQDGRNGTDDDIYVQRVTATGTLAGHWPIGGFPACAAAGQQEFPAIVADGNGGAIVAWGDGRVDPQQIYSTHVPANGTTATLASLVAADASSGTARITWLVDPGLPGHFQVERRHQAGDWVQLATALPDGTGRITLEDRDVIEGERYTYSLQLVTGSMRTVVSSVSLLVGSDLAFRLEGPETNPVNGEPKIAFDLTSSAPATLALWDLAGRRLGSWPVGSLGRGHHVVGLEPDRALAPGLYWVRLERGVERQTARLCVLR